MRSTSRPSYALKYTPRGLSRRKGATPHSQHASKQVHRAPYDTPLGVSDWLSQHNSSLRDAHQVTRCVSNNKFESSQIALRSSTVKLIAHANNFHFFFTRECVACCKVLQCLAVPCSEMSFELSFFSGYFASTQLSTDNQTSLSADLRQLTSKKNRDSHLMSLSKSIFSHTLGVCVYVCVCIFRSSRDATVLSLLLAVPRATDVRTSATTSTMTAMMVRTPLFPGFVQLSCFVLYSMWNLKGPH